MKLVDRYFLSSLPGLFILFLLIPCGLMADSGEGPAGYKAATHKIVVRINPDRHSLEAVDRVSLERLIQGASTWKFNLAATQDINAVMVGGEKAPFKRLSPGENNEASARGESEGEARRVAEWEVDLSGFQEDGKGVEVSVSYSGVINDSLKMPSFSRQFIANQTTGLIAQKGVYLDGDSYWYPVRLGSLSTFSLEVVIPDDFEVVSQGRRVVDEVSDGHRTVKWEAPNLTDVIYLIAGHYDVEERDADGTTIYAYFFPESSDLRDSYLTATARYLKMYSEMIGPYPYAKFAVVENFFETGYGMPSFTLLGSSVIRLPFIIYSSLGHEVLHNWWGNSVFVDSTSGNWCESLTTYMADYYYKEQRGEDAAREYRMEIDKAYSNYVNSNNDFSLAEFTSRTTPATRTVGYGKGAMIYHGLRRMIGDEAFHEALRTFYREQIYKYASFADLQAAFEKAGGVDLDWYFKQWIKGVGAPLLSLEDVRLTGSCINPKVEFVISQEGTGSPYRLEVPVVLETSVGREDHTVELDTMKKAYSMSTSGSPVTVSVDPDFQLFRRMDPLEIPPSLSMVLGDEKEAVVLPDKADISLSTAYSDLAGQLNRTGEAEEVDAGEADRSDISRGAIFILGDPSENSLWGELAGPGDSGHFSPYERISIRADSVEIAGKTFPKEGHSFMAVFRSNTDPGRGVAVFFGYDEESIRDAGRKLVHYGKYGYLVFEGGTNVAKGSWKIENSPLVHRFRR